MTVADNLAMTRLVANLSMSIDPTSDLGFHGLNQKPLGTFPENPAQHILTFTEWKDSCLNVTIVHGGVLLCLVGTRVSSYLHPEYAAFFIQPSTTFGYIPPPRPDPQALTMKNLANAFLNHKQALLTTGELSPRTWVEYRATTDLLIESFGKNRLVSDLRTDDFAAMRKCMAKKWGPHRLGKLIQYVRSVFKHGIDSGLIEKPVIFGPGFKRPSRKTLRLHRAEGGPKLLTREEILRLFDKAGTPMKAMILLGINCGFGNADCGNLPLSALDLKQGIVDYPRPKTRISRRCALWPETITEIKEVLVKRPEPKEPAYNGLVFITKYGLAWSKETSTNPVSQEMRKLLKSLGINGRKGLGFYTLRHVLRTVADEAKDQVAVDFIMGHARDDMASLYRGRISDERLRVVT